MSLITTWFYHKKISRLDINQETFQLLSYCFRLYVALTLLSFFLPPDSGERITLVITNLLAMIVFMLIVAEIMPATSEVIPLISIYYTGIMFEVSNWITFIFHQKAKPSLLSFEIYFQLRQHKLIGAT